MPPFLYVVFIATLLITVEMLPNVWLIRTLCFLIGASLWTCILGSLETSILWLDEKHRTNDQSFRVTFGVMLIATALLFSAFFSWLADRMYYSNRNVTYWVRSEIGITAFFILLSAAVQTCLLRKKQSASEESVQPR